MTQAQKDLAGPEDNLVPQVMTADKVRWDSLDLMVDQEHLAGKVRLEPGVPQARTVNQVERARWGPQATLGCLVVVVTEETLGLRAPAEIPVHQVPRVVKVFEDFPVPREPPASQEPRVKGALWENLVCQVVTDIRVNGDSRDPEVPRDLREAKDHQAARDPRDQTAQLDHQEEQGLRETLGLMDLLDPLVRVA